MSLKERIKKFFTPIDLRQGKEWKVLLKFSLPIIVSYLLQQVYTISDAAICGQTLSADEVAGVNDVSSLMFIVLQFAFGCTAGFTVIISDRVGNADGDGVRRSFATQIILCAIITVVLTAVSMLCLKPMLAWINLTPSNAGVYNSAYSYCMVIFIGIFAQMFYNFICSVLRSIGDSVTPLVFLFISTLINIGLDLLFIVVFKWGVIGAASATVIAQALSTVACFIYTFIKFKNLRLKRSDFKADFKEYLAHLKQGLPLGLQFSVLAIGLIVLQSGVVSFDLNPDGTFASGNPAQNGYGAACKLGGLLMCPMNAYGTALVSFNAQNLGARQLDRIKRGTLQSMIIIFIFYIILAGTGLLLTINGAYLKLFLSADKINVQSTKYGNYYLYVACSLYIILGILFVWRSAAQGIEKPFFTLLAGTAELVARILVCVYLPTAVNGGPINSEASLMAYVALCSADPFAWLGSVLALAYPFIVYICLKKYKFPPEEKTAEQTE